MSGKRLKEKRNGQTTGGLFVANTQGGEPLISIQELCDLTGWDAMTVFEKARSGEIPGAVWGNLLRFKEEEIDAWLQPVSLSELEDALKELEQQGLITSFLDSNGERRYCLPEHLH